MADHPDVYADGLTITVNPLGIALTFTRTEPATPGVNEDASVVIAARVRLSRSMAEAVRDLITQALAAGEQGPQTISH